MRFLKEKYLKNPRIVLFCPTDASYQAFMAEQQPNKMHLKNVILNHLTKKVGKSEMTYKSTLNGQKITIQSTTINDKVGIDPLYANMLKGCTLEQCSQVRSRLEVSFEVHISLNFDKN